MASWQLLALGSAAFAGLTAVLAKIGVEDVPSNLATLLRLFVIVPFLAALVWARGEWRAPAELSHRSLLFLGLSGLATGLSWVCYFAALKNGPASIVSALDKLSMPIAVILSVALLRERLAPAQWVGVGLFLAGAWLLVRR